MTSTREQLKEAYRLIRQDQPEAAQRIIRPILAEDPENVHAWWLLAYSVDDPYEVRDALNKVLELDPNYSNAPKAREMLRTLDEQFFSTQDTAGEIETHEAGDEASESFLEGTFDYDESESEADMYIVEEDTFLAGYDESAPEDDDIFAEHKEDEDDSGALGDLFATPEYADLSDEEKARAEERAGARAGRGRRILTALMFIVVLVLVGIAAFILLQEDDAANEPAALQAVEPATGPVQETLVAARNDLTAAGVGAEQNALLAESEAGQTLYVIFCREPSRELPQDIAFAMQIAVQHAVDVADEIDAVGVSVNRCGAGEDTLYRAFVPVEDALSYANGDLGSTGTAWPEFQRRWRTP